MGGLWDNEGHIPRSMAWKYYKHRTGVTSSSGLTLQGDVFQWRGCIASLPDFLHPLKMFSCGYRGHVVSYQCH